MPDAKEEKQAKSASKDVKVSDKTVKKQKDNKQRLEGLKRYFTELKAEFRKIVWPTPKTVVRNTIVVLVSIVAVGIVIWCLDALTSSGLNAILHNINNTSSF